MVAASLYLTPHTQKCPLNVRIRDGGGGAATKIIVRIIGMKNLALFTIVFEGNNTLHDNEVRSRDSQIKSHAHHCSLRRFGYGFFFRRTYLCVFFRKIGSLLVVALKVLLGTLIRKWSFYALIMIHSSGGNPVFF